jgi:hypothetical protein
MRWRGRIARLVRAGEALGGGSNLPFVAIMELLLIGAASQRRRAGARSRRRRPRDLADPVADLSG